VGIKIIIIIIIIITTNLVKQQVQILKIAVYRLHKSTAIRQSKTAKIGKKR